MHQKRYKYSEIFGNTFQGEGQFCGVPTTWVRFWGCNFGCNGFGQQDPTDPSTYKLDYQTIDISSIKKLEDLPVFNTGCDSSYSWAKKFQHLAPTGTASEICDKLESFLKNEFNPTGTFLHPRSHQWTHLAFTGGEPMLNQNAIVDILDEFDKRENYPFNFTIETNGTQLAREKFESYMDKRFYHHNLFWSVSPKLYLSGEKKTDALKPDVVAQYSSICDDGQLKYVCDGSNRAWDEVDEFTHEYRKLGISWPIWIMPVGATVEGQDKVAATVAEGAIARGYKVAARVHCYVFNNVIGK